MKDSKRNRIMRPLKAAVITLLAGAALTRLLLFTTYSVDGESMYPTLQDGNKLTVNKLAYHVGDIGRFEIIVFHAGGQEDYVKRVIGLPGDRLYYKNDKLYINGKKYDEPYLKEAEKELSGQQLTGDFTLEELTGKERVPEGKLFVLGDNRLESMDSRHFGFIDINQTVGKVNQDFPNKQEARQ